MASRVEHVSPNDLFTTWTQVEPMIERALNQSCGRMYSPDDLLQEIYGGKMVLWTVLEGEVIVGVVVLRVVTRRDGRAVVVMVMAGEQFWRHQKAVHDALRKFAGVTRADRVEAVVRDGLARWLPKCGWKRKATVMEMDLNGR